MGDELEGFTTQQRAKLEALKEAYHWDYGDEIMAIVDGMFGKLVRSGAKDIRGLGRFIFTKHVSSPDKKSQIKVSSEAKKLDDYYPNEVDITYNSRSEEDAELRFGVPGTTDLRIKLTPDGNVSIFGRVLDREKKAIKSIAFFSENLKPESAGESLSRNTMSSLEAMGLVRSVRDSFVEYSTAPKHV